MTKVVNCRDTACYDIYIGRGRDPRTGKLSQFGNPFSHQVSTLARFHVNTRKEAIEKFREWILTQPEMLKALCGLRGKILGCWCVPLACHGHVLAEMVDNL